MLGRLKSSLLTTAPMPAPPVRNFSFTDFQTNNPTAPPPGDKLDSNFDATNAAVAAQLTWASVSINSDGTIRDGIIDANNLVPGLFDSTSQGIIDDVQPLVDEAQSYATLAQTSASNAQTSETDAATQAGNAANSAANADTARAAAANAQAAASVSAASAATAATTSGNNATDAAGSEDQAMLYADLAGAWAEHMPDPIPPDVLAVSAITGDHWSSRWWANKAAESFGMMSKYYAGASGPPPPTQTVTGDPMPVGAMWFNTATSAMMVWDGTQWNTAVVLDPGLPLAVAQGQLIISGAAPDYKWSAQNAPYILKAANSIITSYISDLNVTTSKLADGAVAPSKLSAATLTLINTANPFDQSLNTTDTVRFAGLGVGRALEAWGGAYSVLALGKTMSFYSDRSVSDGRIEVNAYFDGTDHRYLTAANCTSYVQVSGAHLFYSAPGGAVGAIASLTEQMRLDYNGNLGIGRVPEAWSANKAICLGDTGTYYSAVGGATNSMGCNTYFDGANHRFITNGLATAYAQSNGLHAWYSAATGVAGGIAAYITMMSLSATGSLGVGFDQNAATSIQVTNNNTGANSQTRVQWNNGWTGAIDLNSNALVAGGGSKPASFHLYTNAQNGIVFNNINGAAGAIFEWWLGGNKRMSLDQAGHLTVYNSSVYAFGGFATSDDVSSGSFQIGSFGGYLARIGAGGYNQEFNSQNGITKICQANGVLLGPNATAWAAYSSRAVKRDIQPIPGDVFEIIMAHEAGLFRYKTDKDSVPLRPGLFYEDAKKSFPWASVNIPASTMFDPVKDEDVDVPEYEGLSLEQYVPLLMAAFQKQIGLNASLNARLAAGGL